MKVRSIYMIRLTYPRLNERKSKLFYVVLYDITWEVCNLYTILQLKTVDFEGRRSSTSINFSWARPKDCLPNNCAVLKTCYSMILLVLLSPVIATIGGDEVLTSCLVITFAWWGPEYKYLPNSYMLFNSKLCNDFIANISAVIVIFRHRYGFLGDRVSNPSIIAWWLGIKQ